MLRNLLLSAFLLLSFQTSFAQVTTEPASPRADQPVKLIYDASKGTTGLNNCGCDVYIHIGAVTEGPNSTSWSIVPFEWGTEDPEALMTKVDGEDNLYTFELTPNDFFDNPNGLTIYRLGLVFRNGDGSKEGKTDANGDIFVDLEQGFQVTFTHPSSGRISLDLGETYEFKAETSEAATISFEIEGDEVKKEDNTTSLSYSYTAEEAGNFQIEAIATSGDNSDTEIVEIEVFPASEIAPLPEGVRLGINYISDTEVVLALQAPGKRLVQVLGDFNNWERLPAYQMKRTPDGEIFWLEIENLEPKKEYIFQYLVDGAIRIGDPFADKTSDPDHDQEIINDGRYPGLMPYPTGKAIYQATYLQTGQEEYQWVNTSYDRPDPEDLVVYELLVRDFDDRRTYQAVIERLDYLKDLGINAIELMPVGEFEGNISWGYNPSFFFAPDKYYGTKNDLKQLIDEAHGKGIMIIMDMVLNHAFGQSPMVRLYNDGEFGSPTPDNPWFNREATHPFNVGYDFNHESDYTKAFVDSVNNYWLTEYKIDGFRFDLSKGFTQVVSGSDVGKWSQYDASRIAIWKGIYDRIKDDHPEAYVILEHLSENSEEQELANYGLMFWGNMNFDFREIAKGENRDLGWSYYGNRGWQDPNLVAYQESHDEERVMWESLNFGATSPINIQNLENAVNRNQLSTAFYFAVPGPKMLWQFGEFGYDEELNNDRLGIKPTHWEYLENPERMRLFKLYQEMIKLKLEYDAFKNPEKTTMTLSSSIKSIILEDETMDVVLHGNFGLNNSTNIPVSFPRTGTWYNYFTGNEFEVTSTVMNLDFRGSEFVLLTSEKLPTPEPGIVQEDYITDIPEEVIPDGSFRIFPNPTTGELYVDLPVEMKGSDYRIIDMQGNILTEGRGSLSDQILELDVRNIQAGIYIFEAYDAKRVLIKRFIKI